jgi:hypothetical protein
MNSQTPGKSYGQEGDAFLAEFYGEVKDTPQKIIMLERGLGEPPSNYYAFGGSLTDEMKLGCLEYEFLERNNKIVLELA